MNRRQAFGEWLAGQLGKAKDLKPMHSRRCEKCGLNGKELLRLIMNAGVPKRALKHVRGKPRIITQHRIVPGRDGGTYEAPNVSNLCAYCHEDWHAEHEGKPEYRGVYGYYRWLRPVVK